MLYLTIKAFHVIAIVIWIGGMLLAALLLVSMRPVAGPFLLPDDRLLVALQRWDRRVTTPAMASVWVLGLALAMLGHWFVAAWLSAKLVLVLAISALHGIQAGTLRRLMANGTRRKPGAMLRFAPLGIMLSVGAIVVLVILKPF